MQKTSKQSERRFGVREKLTRSCSEEDDFKMAFSMCRESCFLEPGKDAQTIDFDGEAAKLLEWRKHCMTNRIAEIIDPAHKGLQRAHADVFKRFASLLRQIFNDKRDLKIYELFCTGETVNSFQEVFTREERIIVDHLVLALGFERAREDACCKLFAIANSINIKLAKSRTKTYANIYERLKEQLIGGLANTFFGLGKHVDSDIELANMLKLKFCDVDAPRVIEELKMRKWPFVLDSAKELPLTSVTLETIFLGVRVGNPVVFLLKMVSCIQRYFGRSVLEFLAEFQVER